MSRVRLINININNVRIIKKRSRDIYLKQEDIGGLGNENNLQTIY